MIFSEPRIPVLAAVGVVVALSWIALSLRLWVRLVVLRSFGWDDGCLILSAITFTAYCTVCVLIEVSGQISQADSLETARLSTLVDLLIASTELYIGTMVILKIAVGLIYLRIVTAPWQRHVILTTVVFSTVCGIFMFHLTLFNCGDPTHYLENARQRVCMSADTLYAIQMSAFVANALTNWILAILPIFMLIKIAMPVSARLATAGVLVLGSCASFVSLIKVIYIRDLVEPATFFRTVHEVAFWYILECGFGILAASITALRPMFPRLATVEQDNQSQSEAMHKRNITEDSLSDSTRSDTTSSHDRASRSAKHHFYESARENQSHFSLNSVTPAFRRLRVLGRLGLSYLTIRRKKDEPDIPDGSSARVVRRSVLEKSPVNGRLEMCRKISIREKGISHPHLTTRPERPKRQRGESQQQLLPSELKGTESPDWPRHI